MSTKQTIPFIIIISIIITYINNETSKKNDADKCDKLSDIVCSWRFTQKNIIMITVNMIMIIFMMMMMIIIIIIIIIIIYLFIYLLY